MESSPTFQAVRSVEVPVSITLAETLLPLEDVLSLRPGSTVKLPTSVEAPFSLEVDGIPVGDGRIVERDGEMGFLLQSAHTEARPRSI
ncbi:MAG: FliM/FliN family flagellar motor C-terminal domain-containing protein [Planctomycetota bacterium]